MDQKAPLYVTGADARYWRCLYQLLTAVRRKGWNRGADWVAYDLGMTPDQRAILQDGFPWVRWETLNFDPLAPHYAPDAGSYAWKPEVFWREVRRARGPVIWMDSANLPLGRPDEMLTHIRDHGLYLLRGKAPLQERCDPAVLRRMKVPGWVWGARECVSGLIGVDAGDDDMRGIIETWATVAQDSTLIRPETRIDRHMNDQAILNAIIAERVCLGVITLPEQDVDISSGSPVRFLSTRNKVRGDVPLWADIAVRAYYRVNKVLDQFVHRLDDFHLDHNPFWRMSKEYFSVHFSRSDGTPVEIPCPFGHYYADPFVEEEAGETWAFVEDFNYFTDRATLAAIPLSGDRPGKAVQIIDPGCHASFPFLFRHDGALWMLPETCKNGTLELWRCDDFPVGWRRHRVIMTGVNCADSMVFEHDGRWWLMTSRESPFAGGMYRHLAIFHSDDPITGDWVAHPINDTGYDGMAPMGTGRNAGGLIRHEGRMLRPVQNSPQYYGEGMVFREIVTLTPDAFVEREIATPTAFGMTKAEGVHHMSRHRDITIWDRRTRH